MGFMSENNAVQVRKNIDTLHDQWSKFYTQHVPYEELVNLDPESEKCKTVGLNQNEYVEALYMKVADDIRKYRRVL